jgi:hypothetical protein
MVRAILFLHLLALSLSSSGTAVSMPQKALLAAMAVAKNIPPMPNVFPRGMPDARRATMAMASQP